MNNNVADCVNDATDDIDVDVVLDDVDEASDSFNVSFRCCLLNSFGDCLGVPLDDPLGDD